MPADIAIRSFTLSQTNEAHSWTAQIALADVADWHRLSIDDPFNIDLNGVEYALIVDNKQLQRESATQKIPVITAVSPAAKLGPPQAARITRTWTTAVTAKSAVEEVLNQSVDWQMVDWTIAANQLAFTDATPLEIARTIVGAAGGVLRSKPDGTLKVVKQFPVRVPDWDQSTAVHVFTDLSDNVKLVDLQRRREVVNRVYVSSDSGAFSQLQMQLDTRPDGLNAGKTSFAAGDVVGVLVFAPDGAVLDELQTSSGTVHREADQVFEHTDDVHFSATDSAVLTYPAKTIKQVTWLGNDLGAVGVDSDRKTLRISSAGVGVCRVAYVVKATAFNVVTSSELNGVSDYPVQLHIEANAIGASSQRSIIGVRGSADKQGIDISDPILTDINALLQRATIELDHGESLQPLNLQVIYRPGVENGQLVQIDDSDQISSSIGMVNSITHQYNGIKTLTSLGILQR